MAEAALLARLEAVVGRLEAFASGRGASAAGGAAGKSAPAPAAGGGGGGASSPALDDYDQYYAHVVQPWIDTCNKLGGDGKKVGEVGERAFKHLRNVFEAAAVCKSPAPAELQKFMEPITKCIGDAEKLAVKSSPFFPHAKAVAEGLPALYFPTTTAPKMAIEAGQEPAQVFLNRVMVDAKKAVEAKTMTADEQATHRAYAMQFKDALVKLMDYALQHHKMGITWKFGGSPLSSFSPSGGKSGGAAAAAAAAAPAAPADAPPAPDAPDAPSAPDAPDVPAGVPAAPSAPGGMGAVFAQINSAGDRSVTAAFALKKVTREMKQDLKKQPVLEAKAKAAPAAAEKAAAKKADGKKEFKGEPKIALEKGTWFCEFQDGKHDVIIPEVEMKQSVYISKCRNCTIAIPERAKALTIDNCFRVRVVFHSVVSTFEVVNSQRCWGEAQVHAPAVAIDKSSGISVTLSSECIKRGAPDVVTSNISECNLVVPGATDGADPVEIPIPEQYCTRYNPTTRKISTEPVSHGGG